MSSAGAQFLPVLVLGMALGQAAAAGNRKAAASRAAAVVGPGVFKTCIINLRDDILGRLIPPSSAQFPLCRQKPRSSEPSPLTTPAHCGSLSSRTGIAATGGAPKQAVQIAIGYMTQRRMGMTRLQISSRE